MSEWLVDVVRKRTEEQFTATDWDKLGKNHADALVARLVTSELSEDQHADYLRAVIAAYRYSEDALGLNIRYSYYAEMRYTLERYLQLITSPLVRHG